jgi:hypothetical protein
MLKHEGYTRHGYPVPTELLQFFKDAHDAHKKKVVRRVFEGKQAYADFHAQNASWRAVEYCAEKLHDGTMKNRYPSTHMYFLGSVQNIGRGERMGKYPYDTWCLGDTGDHIAGGKGFPTKTDPKGEFSYNKRFWPNWKNPKMCFLTALGVHLLSLRPKEKSNFMFMSKKEARKYDQELTEQRKRNVHKASSIGPHKGFHRTITKCFHPLSGDERVALGISKTKNYVAHSSRMTGYARAICGDGVDAAMVSTRAEHHSSNYNRYGTRAIAGVKSSGGPPAIHDITMAKLLAGLDQYTPEFNVSPPHWAADVVMQINFPAIMPVYEQLPSGLKDAVPLLVANVVYHYHRDKRGMDKRHRLFTSPLWTNLQTFRHNLFTLLRGADTGQASVLKETFRDKRTDEYQWINEINERTKV